MPSDSGSAWSPPASNGERRLSNSSDGSAGSGYSKATTDSADFLATRPHTAAVIPGKPAANPLQFIKVGPADLGSRAREQLRRAELAKRTEPARIERPEDWQSNLDNWKSSRRKRVEHIIERCVEVKRMENEPAQPRSKSKTFNEMLEERAGRRRRNPLALYAEDDSHDLSDLGIGTSSTKSSLSEDCDTHSLASDGMDLDKNHSDVDNMSNCDTNRKLGSSANEYDTCTTTTISSPEPEEYTYEGAIEGYKSRINSSIVKTLVNNNKEKSPDKLDLNRIRTSVSNKIEEKVSSFQFERLNDSKNNNQKKDLPKVDIHKRREQFERENSQESQTKPKLPEIANKKSIKERLSSLEKFTEESQMKSTSDLTKLTTEVKPLKERLSSLEKVKSASSEPDKVKRLSNGDLANTKSLRERLSSLKSQKSEEEVKVVKTEVKEVSMSLKERLSCLDAAKNKEVPKISVVEEIARCEKNDVLTDDMKDHLNGTNLKSNLSEIENQMQSFCRSLDSLDINGQTSPSSFERVQSLEDFEAEMQSNTVPSDIETEDSGIHTARDSAPADDIADLTQVASPIGEPLASEYESSNEDGLPMDHKIEEPIEHEKTPKPEPMQTIVQDIIIEEIEDQADDDSGSHYAPAVSQPEELSVTDEVTEIQLDKEDEDTLKSLENQDTSVLDALELAFQELDSEDKHISKMEDKQTKEDSQNNLKQENNQNHQVKEGKVANHEEENKEKKVPVTPLYENIDVFYQNDAVDAFPLDLPTNVLEPPKEKPPPPPTEDSQEDELLGNGNFKHTSSARRIKKEIRNKRSSFLGIEGQDDSYLDVDLTLAPRPDITSFLQEETKIEKLLYKKTLSHDMDSKLRESRDSGVDVDRGPSAEAWYKGHSSPDVSNPHSRQNSEPYTHVTLTSDEEELKKEFNSTLKTKLTELGDNPIDELDKKLQHQQEVLRFERELLQLEQEELRRQRENLLRDQNRIIQKSVQDVSVSVSPEKPPLNRERQNDYRHSMPNLLVNESYSVPKQPERPTYDENLKRKPFVSEEQLQRHFGVEESRRVLYEREGDRKCNYDELKQDRRSSLYEDKDRKPILYDERQKRLSLYDDKDKRSSLYDEREKDRLTMYEERKQHPILPPKPRSRESIEREITMRSSRVPSAVEYVNIDRSAVQLRQKNTQTNGQYQHMTRHTLQALSAAPTPKLISSSDWMQAKTRKPTNYNQHWLIQEAEQRRIDDARHKQRAPHSHSHHEDITTQRVAHSQHNYTNSQQVQEVIQREAPRDDKLLTVSGKRKCSHCGEELGRGAAMIIESLSLCYHVWCFTCCVCGARLGDGRAGAAVRVRRHRLYCRACRQGDDGRQYSAV